jgi:hypothetical protein
MDPLTPQDANVIYILSGAVSILLAAVKILWGRLNDVTDRSLNHLEWYQKELEKKEVKGDV